jgi:mRNA interferase MazF
MEIKRGEVIIINLDPIKGSEQGGERPCVVLQNNLGNKFSPVTIVAPITTKKFSKEYPTNVSLMDETFLNKGSNVLLNQIKTIDKSRIIKKIGILNNFTMNKINLAIKISLHLG